MNVFLTGATGFLGGELAVLLSQSPEIGRVYCLIRGQDDAEALKRLREVFDFHGDAFDPERIVAVRGDLKDESLAEKLAAFPGLDEVELVIHSGADTSFAPASTESVERVNIGGTLQILRWAQALPRLRTFTYVGTASIVGANQTHCHVHEDQSPHEGARHLVRYCYTKMVGETHVTRMIPREKLLIVRPSIIMGDSRDVKPRSYVILWVLAALNAIRMVPATPNSNLDVIPVDYAAQAILSLIFSERHWTTYHISAGRTSATTLEKLTTVIEPLVNHRPRFQYVARELLHDMKKWPKRLKPPSDLFNYREHLEYWSANFNGNLRVLLAGLSPYFRFIELSQTFDNTRLLADTGLPSPPPSHEYLRSTGKYLNQIDLVEGALDP